MKTENVISTLKTIHAVYKYCQSVLMLLVVVAVVGAKYFWNDSDSLG